MSTRLCSRLPSYRRLIGKRIEAPSGRIYTVTNVVIEDDKIFVVHSIGKLLFHRFNVLESGIKLIGYHSGSRYGIL